jgi:hypothetical protein
LCCEIFKKTWEYYFRWWQPESIREKWRFET